MEAAAGVILMMLPAGGPLVRLGVGLGARLMGWSDTVEELAVGNREGVGREGTVGRMNCDEGMGVGVGQIEEIRKGARSVLGVSERRML